MCQLESKNFVLETSDAILLAAAGVNRLDLDLSDLLVLELDPRHFVPAAAQGVLAYQTRSEDQEMIDVVGRLHHPLVKEEIEIERRILSGFGGGCHIPIGINTIRKGESFDVRVSYSSDPDLMANRSFFQCNSLSQALAKFDELRNKTLPKSVLITRNANPGSYLSRVCDANGIDLKCQPFIEIEALTFDYEDHFDWIFFSSSNAVHSFFKQKAASEIEDKKFAAYGDATSRTLFQYTTRIDFIAEPGQPEEVAIEFKSIVGDQHVLFPVSDVSKKSIQSVLSPNQVSNVVCYSTKHLPISVDQTAEVVVFTSPSNVHGYHLKNDKIQSEVMLIALGSSTAKALKELGYACKVADFANDVEVFTLLSS